MGFYIEMISVGEGDSFLLTLDTPDKSEAHVLIDGGNGDRANRIIGHVKKYAGGRLELVIATHLDDDHIGGLIPLIKDQGIKVDTLVLNTPGNFQRWLQLRTVLKSFTKVASLQKVEKSLESTNGLLETAKKRNIPVQSALAGNVWKCYDVKLIVLNPTKERLEAAWAEKIAEDISKFSGDYLGQLLVEKGVTAPPTTLSNDSSIILELIHGSNCYALFTADAGAAVIKEVTNAKSYRFLKVPHHGSKTGLDEDLIKQVKPTWAYIPVGENPHGHPNLETLDLLRQYGATTYCSEKTKDCRRECKHHDFTVLCHQQDKPSREEWSTVDSKDCKNNIQ